MKTITIYKRTILERTGYRKYPYKEVQQVTISYDRADYSNHINNVFDPRLKVPFEQVLKTRSAQTLSAYTKTLGRSDADKWQKGILEILLNQEAGFLLPVKPPMGVQSRHEKELMTGKDEIMLKESYKDVFKVYAGIDNYYTDEPFEVIAQRLQDDGGAFTISKKSAPFEDWESASVHAARLDLVMYNDYSSGGGFHHAACVYNDRIYTIDNDFPLVLTIYGGDDLDDAEFTEENMIHSIEVNDGMTATERSIYEFLLAILSE